MNHKTPTSVLQDYIDAIEYFIQRLETGIGIRHDLSNERRDELIDEARKKIQPFKDAIVILGDRILPEERDNLHKLYGILWMEAHYDSKNAETGNFCKEPAAIMTELNRTMKFKE